MDSILVTGSLGFIGREIIKKITKTKIITDSNNSKRINLQNINEVLEIGKNSNAKYLVLDNNNKFDFLDEIYHNETNYENLEKVFDSKEQGYKHYSIKIFKLP